MKKRNVIHILLLLHAFVLSAQQKDSLHWWRQNNLRVIQTNLPDYEAAALNADSLVNDLMNYSANTLIINAGGIMAFYPSKLDYHYINPYIKNEMLRDVIEKCHRQNIRVIVRFDFSRIHESIFKANPDWCYVSKKGEHMINRDMYVTSINAPYVQEKAFNIIAEVMNKYPIDGIFLNMPGYQVNNAYEGKYYGIDQNEYDKKRFSEWSHGKSLPVEENKSDSLYQLYLSFKKFTVEDWSERLHKLVKAKNPAIAICTYSDKFVDIIRHESQANATLPYWPYNASDNVNNAGHSFPNHIVSNASIQQISFQSRYNAIEPEEVAIRFYENIANGSGLDVSLMGDMRNYEDERNFPVIKKIYRFHKDNEPFFGNYASVAKIALIAPGAWPSGLPMQEYRGIQLMLKEAHIPFDIIEEAQIVNQASSVKKYSLLIFPDITFLGKESKAVLKEAISNGTNVLATNTSFADDPQFLSETFGAKAISSVYDGAGNYLQLANKNVFHRLAAQQMVFWKYNLGQYDFTDADSAMLPILAKGRPGPPEIIGGHEPTGYYAMGIKQHGQSKAVLIPANIGRIYYQQGYEEHKHILLDVINYIFPNAGEIIKTDFPARVEMILQQFGLNVKGSDRTKQNDGMLLHLINLTGFSGATYFPPIPLYNKRVILACPFRPTKVFGLTNKQAISYKWAAGKLSFTIKELAGYEGIVIQR